MITTKKQRNNHGFTLIEVIVALSIFVVMATPLFSFLAYSLRSSEQLLVKNYLLENARITLDFITTQARMANELSFTVIEANGKERIISSKDATISPSEIFTLCNIKFKGILENKDSNIAIIAYNYSIQDETNSKYHRVDFGGNNDEYDEDYIDKVFRVGELSRYIADIKISFDFNLDIVYVKVITDEKIGNDAQEMSPIILEGTISLFNKKIRHVSKNAVFVNT